MTTTAVRLEGLTRDFEAIRAVDGLSLDARAFRLPRAAREARIRDLLVLPAAVVRFRRSRLIVTWPRGVWLVLGVRNG